MKVKNLVNGNGLKYEGIYNVFCIGELNNKEKKYYISDYEENRKFYLSPFNSNDFEIVDGYISKFWEYGIDNFGDIYLGIPEIFKVDYFWEKYYNEDEEVFKVLKIYYNIGKNELFNLKEK